MRSFQIGAEVRVRGTFTVELADNEDIETFVNKLQRDDLEVLDLLTNNAYDATDAEVDDIKLIAADGSTTDIYFEA